MRDIFSPLVRSCTAVDQVFVFQRHEGARGFLHTMRDVRRQQFDVVCDFQGLLRTGLMTKWARARRKVGRPDAREGAGFFYQEKIALPPAGHTAHALETLLQFCPVVDAEPRLVGPLRFRDVDRLNLTFMEPRKGQRPILLFPDSGQDNKKWNGFGQLTALLIREAGRKVVWAGSNYLPCRESFPDGTFINLTGNTSLTSLPALLTKADWVISNDSGPMHLSAAMGFKTIGLSGDRSAPDRALSAEEPDQLRHPGAGRRPEPALGQGSVLSLQPDRGIAAQGLRNGRADPRLSAPFVAAVCDRRTARRHDKFSLFNPGDTR